MLPFMPVAVLMVSPIMAGHDRFPHEQARTDAGVPEGAVRVTDEALAALVDDYARCELSRRPSMTVLGRHAAPRTVVGMPRRPHPHP